MNLDAFRLATYAVPYLLSFAPSVNGRASALVMGRGEAGWTVAKFTSPAAALRFAHALPEASRMRSFSRTIAALESATR